MDSLEIERLVISGVETPADGGAAFAVLLRQAVARRVGPLEGRTSVSAETLVVDVGRLQLSGSGAGVAAGTVADAISAPIRWATPPCAPASGARDA